MSRTVSIRPALPGDARRIAEVHVRTWQDTYAGQMPADYLAGLSVDEREAMWARVLARSSSGQDRTWIWVAVDPEGTVTGFLCFVDGASGATVEEGPDALPEIKALYVSPERQSAGAGSRLMERALDQARSLRAPGIRLAVLEGNRGARRFYERHGFRYVRTTLDRLTPDVEVPHAHYALQWGAAGSKPGDGRDPVVSESSGRGPDGGEADEPDAGTGVGPGTGGDR